MEVKRGWWQGLLAITLLAGTLTACRTQGAKPTLIGPVEPPGNRARVWQEVDTPLRHSEATFREIGEEGGLVVLPSRSEVKVLNPVGIRVLSLLDGKHTVRAIARAVTEEFEVDYTTAIKDVIRFVEELDENGMLAMEAASEVPEK